MNKLSDGEIEFINKCLGEGKPLPDSYRYIIPFETKKEYELTYEGKEREEDILADTMAVPLQPVKTFGDGNGGWTNKLIFGDNLQVLKALMDNPEVYDKNTGRGKVRLIYIDPPFATRQEFRGSQDQKAYQDKIVGAQFMEFFRKRLVFLRELLADDGSIYVHLDWKKVHYVKSLIDEIFGENNFIREIIWRIGWVSGFKSVANNWVRNHDTLLYYGKNKDQVIFNKIYTPYPPDYERWGGRAKGKGLAIEDVWGVFPQEGVTSLQVVSFASQYTGFPTQKPEGLLGRIIKASTNPSDIVLDAFAGSGTTGAVAEKLDRKWIMIDCGKLAIYTMQKRLLNLKEEIGNRGKPLKPKPFTLYNAGLYDYKMVKDLPWEKYREFVLKLFQCRDERYRIAGLELDGYLGADSVMVFNYKKHEDVILDREFIDDLHKILGDKVGYRFFIIVPAASVMFFEDYIEKGKTKYFVLRIPYSIIDELHRKGFTHIKQPIREADVNDTIDAVGFDFIQIPDVECEYFIEDKKGQAEIANGGKEAAIKIEKFKSNILSKKPLEFENRGTLSMVMVDYNYDGEVFDFDDVFYAEDLKKNDWEVRFDVDKIAGQMMIIYIDIFGNEKREVKQLKEFRE
ncbi:MAG: site-specific DNA-methyltransferase [Euryarchaeota archaeon]|nr:site-specific DNA-methyltransferase [Euryarchaeota archaeon]